MHMQQVCRDEDKTNGIIVLTVRIQSSYRRREKGDTDCFIAEAKWVDMNVYYILIHCTNFSMITDIESCHVLSCRW